MLKFEDFILEKYGSNNYVKLLTQKLVDIINYNFGKLILNKSIGT